MAQVLLSLVWIHDAVDLSDALVVLADMTERAAQTGEQRRYAGGRVRTVSRPGVASSYAVTLPWPSRAELDALRPRIGKLQMIRDPAGRRMWGTFFDLDVSEVRADRPRSVSFTFNQVTFEEGV